MRTLTVVITLAAGIAIAGCRSDRDGMPVAQLGAEQLAASGTVEGAGSRALGPEITLRRLSTGSDYAGSDLAGFRLSDISPDGRYVEPDVIFHNPEFWWKTEASQ